MGKAFGQALDVISGDHTDGTIAQVFDHVTVMALEGRCCPCIPGPQVA